MPPLFKLIAVDFAASDIPYKLAWSNELLSALGIILIVLLSINALALVKGQGWERMRKLLLVAVIPPLAIFFLIVVLRILYVIS